MDPQITKALLDSLAAVLRPRLEDSKELRALALHTAQWLSALAAECEPASTSDAGASPGSAGRLILGQPRIASDAPLAAAVRGPQVVGGNPGGSSAASVPLQIGDSLLHVRVSGTTQEIGRARAAAAASLDPAADNSARAGGGPSTAGPALIARRCQLKVKACDVFIRRRLAIGTPDEDRLIGEINELIREGKQLPGCFLWMVFPGREQPSDADLRLLAANYANLGAAASLYVRVLDAEAGGEDEYQALALLAEAQSALSVGLEQRTWLTKPDQDQTDAFVWVRRRAGEREVFIERHLRLEDPADPGAHEDLAARIEATSGRVVNAQKREKAIVALLNKIRHHAKRIAEAGPDDDPGNDWAKIASSFIELQSAGLPRNDPRAASAVARLIDAVPPAEHATGPLAWALEAAARAARGEETVDPDIVVRDPREYSQIVQLVREHLAGKRIVLFGGESRPEAISRLTEAFRLGDIAWVSLREHASSAPLEAEIANPDTAAVFALVKLAGHQHIDDARRWCEKYDKPFIRLPAGYNPERVASEFSDQAGRLLGSASL